AGHGVPVLHALPVAHRSAKRGVRPALEADTRGRPRPRGATLHRPGRPPGIRAGLPEGALRRDDATGRERARPGERPRGPSAGRTPRRPRGPAPVPHARVAPPRLGRGVEDGAVRDARHRGGAVPRRPGVRDDGSTGPDPRGNPGAASPAADCGHADVGRLRGTQAAGNESDSRRSAAYARRPARRRGRVEEARVGTHPIHPGYAGIPTFFQAPYAELDGVGEGMTVVAGVPIDQGIITAKPGTRFGPRAIREASQGPRGILAANVEHTWVDVDTGVALRLKDHLDLVD